MSIQRLVILTVFVIFGYSSLHLLPSNPKRPEPGISMKLPDFIGAWYGEDVEVSEREIAILGPDTTFSRKVYSNGAGDHIFVSIVMAGQDMNTSIHRPERCLPSQGYVVMSSEKTSIPFKDEALTVTRLHNRRNLPLNNGQEITEFSLNYYWFVGSSSTTAGHFERNFMDIRDRALKGYAQPWAYVTVMSRISEGLRPFGKTEAQTDEMIRSFTQELLEQIQYDSVKIR